MPLLLQAASFFETSLPFPHYFLVTNVVQVISKAADNVIKVWDLRNHRCIQTITDLDWPSQEDAHPSVMMYDVARYVFNLKVQCLFIYTC